VAEKVEVMGIMMTMVRVRIVEIIAIAVSANA